MSTNSKIRVCMVAIAGLGLLLYRQHASSTFAADGLNGHWDAAVDRSRQTHRPAVVLFTADWCPSCRHLHDEVLSRESVQNELDRYHTFVRIDMTAPGQEEERLATACGVRGIPLLIRYDADGNETDRTYGKSEQSMLTWLADGR